MCEVQFVDVQPVCFGGIVHIAAEYDKPLERITTVTKNLLLMKISEHRNGYIQAWSM